MKTFSELQGLAKSLVRRVVNNHTDTGIIVITYNRGRDRTPVAMFTHATKEEHPVLAHMLRSMADQVESSDAATSQGMFITPSGLLVPKA